MFKKILSAVTALLIVAGAVNVGTGAKYSEIPLTANALTVDGLDDFTDDIYEGFVYRKFADHVVILNFPDQAFEGKLVIPDEIDGVPVTELAGEVFVYCEHITEITIPESVTSIGNGAFLSCSSLTKITLPNGLREIGIMAFYRCKNLSSVVIPESVEVIGSEAFCYCQSLSSISIMNPSCEIYDDETTISTLYSTFEGTIRGYKNSTAQDYAVKYSYNFEALENDDTEWNYGLFKYEIIDDHVIITDCKETASTVIIPAKIDGLPVTEIGDHAFEYCSVLKEVTLPDTIERICGSAFKDCSSLNKINIPDSVKEIYSNAFYRCESLTKITLPSTIERISESTFFGCESLTEITIPESVTTLDMSAFAYCTNLTEITIPKSLVKIGGHAFTGTKWLENKQAENPLVIVNNILIDGTTCGEDPVIPNSVTSIGDYAFHYHLTLNDITIPDSVTSIGAYAFGECPKLTKITIPNSVQEIKSGAFYRCPNLTKITILNPECKIRDDSYTISNGKDANYKEYYNGVIRGYDNSTAQAYAEKYDYSFESLGDSPTPTVKYGDANCDGAVTIADATAILQHLGNKDKYALTAQGELNADVDLNGNGITAADAIAIQQLDAGLVTSLPVSYQQ